MTTDLYRAIEQAVKSLSRNQKTWVDDNWEGIVDNWAQELLHLAEGATEGMDDDCPQACDKCHKQLFESGLGDDQWIGISDCSSIHKDCPCKNEDTSKDFNLCGECGKYDDVLGMVVCEFCKEENPAEPDGDGSDDE